MTVAPTVTFLTDLGSDGEVAGILASIVIDLAPATTIIHLTHDIAPYDVRAGSLALARSVGYLASGVVVASVDPTTDRPNVAVEVAGGRGIFIAPDNGLVASAVAMAGGAERAVYLTNAELHLPSPGSLMAVRDVLAPVAGHLCAGVPFVELGDLADPDDLLPGVLPISRSEDGGVAAEVLWVDRFGNVQLNVDPTELAVLGDRVQIRIGTTIRSALSIESLGQLHEGQLALVTDAYGLVSLVLRRHSASVELGLVEGDAVWLASAGPEAGTVTAVQLRR